MREENKKIYHHLYLVNQKKFARRFARARLWLAHNGAPYGARKLKNISFLRRNVIVVTFLAHATGLRGGKTRRSLDPCRRHWNRHLDYSRTKPEDDLL